MQYSPKLKKVMEQIKGLMEENDIAGMVILHTPGFGEHYTKLDPSYSCARRVDDGIRIKAKLQEDFGGDKSAWEKKVSDTVNMFVIMEELTSLNLMPIIQMNELLQKHVEITKDSGEGYTSHTTQNN